LNNVARYRGINVYFAPISAVIPHSYYWISQQYTLLCGTITECWTLVPQKLKQGLSQRNFRAYATHVKPYSLTYTLKLSQLCWWRAT